MQRSTLDYIVSVEFPLPGDTRLNLQGFQRAYFDGGGGDIAIKSDGFGASVFLSTKLTAAFEPQILWIQNFKDAGGLIRPRLNWYAGEEHDASASASTSSPGRATATSAATTTATASIRNSDTTSERHETGRRSPGCDAHLVPALRTEAKGHTRYNPQCRVHELSTWGWSRPDWKHGPSLA